MNSNKHLIASGTLFVLVLILWPVFMMLSKSEGDIDQQLLWVSENVGLYKTQFFFAFLLSPAIVYLMLAQLLKMPALSSLQGRFGTVFLTGYVVLISISYGSQMILVPGLLAKGYMEMARSWYFMAPGSISYFLNQTGYFFWAIAALCWFWEPLSDKGFIKIVSIIYLVSALLSFVAFTGLILDNMALNSMTFYSGILLLPVGIITIIWGLRNKRVEKRELRLKKSKKKK